MSEQAVKAQEAEMVASFDGAPLAVYRWGSDTGVPIVLCHGFASTTRRNFAANGIVADLTGAGRRVVGFDARGHGSSAKPHDPSAYADDAAVKDVGAILDALEIESCDLVGYSMGAFTSFRFCHRDTRPRSLVLGGVGALVLQGRPPGLEGVAAAMEAADSGEVSDSRAKGFRRFAERNGNDLKALAAMHRGRTAKFEADPSRVKIPTLVVVGHEDRGIGDPKRLVAALPDARLVVTPGDHLGATSEPEFRKAVVDFLTSRD